MAKEEFPLKEMDRMHIPRPAQLTSRNPKLGFVLIEGDSERRFVLKSSEEFLFFQTPTLNHGWSDGRNCAVFLVEILFQRQCELGTV